MPVRWSSSTGVKSFSPFARAFLSTIAKSSSKPLEHRPHLPRSALTKSILPRNNQIQQPIQSKLGLGSSSFRTFQSTPPSHQNLRTTLASIASVSKSIALAGTGTLTSTLLALYLATVVETAAHQTLYEYFPHKYYEIREEDLPTCLREREMRRRLTGEVSVERVRGRVWDERYLSVDGWVIPEEGGDSSVGASELLEEEELENALSSVSSWQRRMTEKRERIIAREEREFNKDEGMLSNGERTLSWPLWGESTAFPSSSSPLPSSSSNKNVLERRKVQEEMARKFQESLLSTAMTA
ncbi:hypothetical protein HJC23_007471 [Cyclotella cryptica]|uniref:Uncharacterized protein n=1 Tax=Cyclotella cryptica TaxID=29204 RepID=A0ABD3NV47_9STRA|eukprot:CCRYP_019696-RA/>CCRYP_019696-RA protein AED:0.41 eAED:0.41 QI:0/-1/0/1/-1/1/1/0/296